MQTFNLNLDSTVDEVNWQLIADKQLVIRVTLSTSAHIELWRYLVFMFW